MNSTAQILRKTTFKDRLEKEMDTRKSDSGIIAAILSFLGIKK